MRYQLPTNRGHCGLFLKCERFPDAIEVRRLLRFSIHAALYAAAVLLFYYGLGVSLTGDRTTFGGIMWVIAGVILVCNTGWILWHLSKKENAR